MSTNIPSQRLRKCIIQNFSDAVKRRSGELFYRLIKNKEYISNIPYSYFFYISKKPFAASPLRRNFSPWSRRPIYNVTQISQIYKSRRKKGNKGKCLRHGLRIGAKRQISFISFISAGLKKSVRLERTLVSVICEDK